jgi:hypothetical protein
MHKNSKFLIPIALILVASLNSSAQFKLPHAQIFADINYATPSSSAFKDANNGGIGAEAGAGVGLGATMLLATAGYQTFGSTLSNPNGNLHVMSLKGGLRHYFLLGRIFVMGNVGTAIQSYSKSAISGNNLLTEFGAGFRLFGLEIQATQSNWKQPIDAPAPNAYNIKFGYSFKL